MGLFGVLSVGVDVQRHIATGKYDTVLPHAVTLQVCNHPKTTEQCLKMKRKIQTRPYKCNEYNKNDF
jgi:hypothetical protein